MRTIILLAIVTACFALGSRFSEDPAAPASAIQQSESNIGFEWAFGVLATNEKVMTPIPISRDTVLKSGDEIKLMVKLAKECFVYILHQGPKGEVNLLFPYQIQQFQKDYLTDKNYYIPKGRDWLKLDKTTGKEIFFVVASTDRLLDLESKIGNYFSADASKKQILANDLVSEIRNVRKRYTTFATNAEKPVTIGGNIRGTEKVEGARRPDVANISVQVKATNFYSKTITIDHE